MWVSIDMIVERQLTESWDCHNVGKLKSRADIDTFKKLCSDTE